MVMGEAFLFKLYQSEDFIKISLIFIEKMKYN